MFARHRLSIALCGWVITTASAGAGTIDLLELPGNQFSVPWGPSGTSLYAQSVLADDAHLASVTMRAHANFFDMFFTLVVTGTRPDAGGLGLAPDFADTRYTSTLRGIPAQRTVEYSFTPVLPVAPGETLFLVFDTFSHPQYPLASGGFWSTAFDAAVDPYPPGEFVFLNTGNLGALTLTDLDAYGWSHRADNHQDLALRVEFTPEPAALILMLSCVPLIARRFRS